MRVMAMSMPSDPLVSTGERLSTPAQLNPRPKMLWCPQGGHHSILGLSLFWEKGIAKPFPFPKRMTGHCMKEPKDRSSGLAVDGWSD